MELLSPIGGIIGLAGFVMLIVALLRTNTEQSFAAFLLWAMLDGIATITTIIQHGNYWLPLANAAGSATITIILIGKKQISWSWIETMTALLVVGCLVVWYTSGEQAGIVASSLAVVIASVPQMVDTFKKPEATPTLVYTVFLIGNILSVVGGKDWSIEERFYQCCGVFLCAVIVGFSMKKLLR